VDVRDTTGAVRINNLVMRNIASDAVRLNGANGVKYFSGINGTNISGYTINSSSSSGSFTLSGGTFDNIGNIFITNSSGAVYVLNSEIKNSKGTSALRISAVNTDIDKLTITGCRYNFDEDEDIDYLLSDPSAIYLICSGKVSVSNTTIDTVKYSYFYRGEYCEEYGNGIRISGSGSFSLKNSAIKNLGQGIRHTGSIDLEIDRLDMQDLHGYGIYSSASGDRNTNISNITASNITSNAIYQYSSSGKKMITVKDSVFDNTGSVYIRSYTSTTSSSNNDYNYVDIIDNIVDLNNVSMSNVRSGSVAINISAKNVNMNRVNINRGSYTPDSNSGGVKIEYANWVGIYNSTINNCGDTRYDTGSIINRGSPDEYTLGDYGWEGAGIYIQCNGTAEISNTTIENVEACLGGAIYYCFNRPYNVTSTTIIGSGADSLTLRNVTVRNAKALYQPSYASYNNSSIYNPCGYGGGLYFYSKGKLNIIDTVMENCSSEVNNGAIATFSSNNTISGSQFINCTSVGSIKVLDTGRFNSGGYTITP
jgi:hypothetical protein